MFSVKNKRTHSPTIYSPVIHSPTWKLKQNKRTRKCSKKGNTPRKWWFKSNQFERIHVLTSFCLASDPQRKNVSLAYGSIWKRPNSHQPVFRPEATGAGCKVQSKKSYTGWNANSYINRGIDLSTSWVTLEVTFMVLMYNKTPFYIKFFYSTRHFKFACQYFRFFI